MGDIGEIKGKVSIEYDGSGVGAAKKDLESLADIVGGGLTESTGTANEALSSLDEQMGKSAGSTASLTSSVGALEKPLQSSTAAVTDVTAALGEHQAVIEDTGKAYENLQSPIEGTTEILQKAVPPWIDLAGNVQGMQEHLGSVNTGFAQMGDTLSQTVPMLPQMASGMHSVSEQFDPKAFGLDTFNENWAVFQDAMVNPYPFQMIHQHLNETGQTYDDFASSIGDSNAAVLDQMATMPVASQKAFGAMSSGAQGAGQSFVAAAGETEAFNQQWASMAAGIEGINKEGGMGTALYGPEEPWNKLDKSLASTEASIGKIGAVGGAAAEGGDLWGSLMGGLHNIAMPLMAVQMIGMAVGQVSQGIYNMAALAEGPAAHSVGSFTGAIDVMGQHAQKTAEQFSEGLGKGIQPMLDAMNNVSSGQSNDFWSSWGTGIGRVGTIVGSVAQITAGWLVDMAHAGFTLDPNTAIGNSWLKSGTEGLQNLWADYSGQQEPFPSGGGSSQDIQINLPAIQQSLTQSIAVMNAQANNPQYLAAQAYLQSQAGYAQLGQAGYNVSHTSGQSPFDYTPQSYQNAMGKYALANGGSGYGLSDVDLNRAYFNSFPYQSEPNTTVSCFPAGTPVLMADGTEKAIEALQIGEHVLAHDGTKQVATTIMARIKPHPKQVYELLLDDGNTLTLTDSHPIMTEEGWKSLSPASTKRENLDLAVSPLQIGDCIHTRDGFCALSAIEPREIVQIYNITVSDPHTFYASGILVHNKSTAAQIMNNVANSTVPQVDMKNSNLIQSLASNFTDADLTHTFTASVSWVADGLSHGFTGKAGWVGEGLTTLFTGKADWLGQGLANLFTGKADWLAQGLTTLFTGKADWIGQGLQNVFQGVASWVASGGLQHTFQGVADWIGQNLSHTFTGVADWIGQGLSQTFAVPGFASGVQNFSGGLAVVGEYGPELVHLPPGTSVYPQSATGGFPSLDMGGGYNSAPLTITINHTTTLDGKVVAQSTIPYVAPLLRAYFGVQR